MAPPLPQPVGPPSNTTFTLMHDPHTYTPFYDHLCHTHISCSLTTSSTATHARAQCSMPAPSSTSCPHPCPHNVWPTPSIHGCAGPCHCLHLHPLVCALIHAWFFLRFQFNSNSIPNKSPALRELFLIVLVMQSFEATYWLPKSK